MGKEKLSDYEQQLLDKYKVWRFIQTFGSCLIRASDDPITAIDRVTFYASLLTPVWLSIQFKTFFDAYPNLQTSMWAVAITFILGKAIWHLYGRYDDHIAIPQIGGTWIRKDIQGVITIYQDGTKITSKFPISSVDHTGEGMFDPIQRNFKITTVRVDSALPLNIQRYVYPETWWLLDENSLVFHTERNALGNEEAGILKRRT